MEQDRKTRLTKRRLQRKAARTQEKQAPGDLETVRAFVNTVARGKQADELATPALVGTWLEDHGLLATGATLDETEQQRALDLRRGLRSLILTHTGGEANPNALEGLAAAAADGRFALRFEGGVPVGFGPSSRNFDDALGALAAIVVNARLEGHWSRLKICPERACGQVFFDTARSRGVWCSPQCGDRHRAATHRRRRR